MTNIPPNDKVTEVSLEEGALLHLNPPYHLGAESADVLVVSGLDHTHASALLEAMDNLVFVDDWCPVSGPLITPHGRYMVREVDPLYLSNWVDVKDGHRYYQVVWPNVNGKFPNQMGWDIARDGEQPLL